MIPANLETSNAVDSAPQLPTSSPTSPVVPPNPSAAVYHTRLHPWCIIRLLPKMQRVVVARFRRRNSAEDHLRVLKRLNSNAVYEIVFDLPDD